MSATVSPETNRFSARFLTQKVRERGVIWCLGAAISQSFLVLFWGSIRTATFPLVLLGVRIVRINSDRIGHLALELDTYVKEGILGMRPSYKEVVLVPSDTVANRHLLDYWRKHLRILTSPILCRVLGRLSRRTLLGVSCSQYAGIVNGTARYAAIQAEYDTGPPLVATSEAYRERGWAQLEEMGMPQGAWFVAVHCREPGFFHRQIHDYRDTDIFNYVPAMKAIVERGGWCVRMGDSTMVSLPPLEHVIDYAKSNHTSEWMDVFLCANCKFYLGSGSGLHVVSNIFSVPTAEANRAPMSVILPYGPRDLGISKLIWSCEEGGYLSFEEVLGSWVGDCRYTNLYDEAGLTVVENTPDDISDLAIEMLDKVDGVIVYNDEDKELQRRFKSLMKPGHYSYGSSSGVGSGFLRRHSDLFSDKATVVAEPGEEGVTEPFPTGSRFVPETRDGGNNK